MLVYVFAFTGLEEPYICSTNMSFMLPALTIIKTKYEA